MDSDCLRPYVCVAFIYVYCIYKCIWCGEKKARKNDSCFAFVLYKNMDDVDVNVECEKNKKKMYEQ